jgi:hypothetical protein
MIKFIGFKNFMFVAIVLSTASCAAKLKEQYMFTVSEFNHIRFLEGRWEGTGPDGAKFYEQYAFSNNAEMKTNRFKDSSFVERTDGSNVKFENGEITSTWNEFTWKASEMKPGKACFSPTKAPSSFCWEQISESLVHVTQRWSDEKGNPQQFVIPLRRL